MNAKKLKQIRKYAKLRGGKDIRINEDILKKIYENSEEKLQKEFDDEMELYIRAVEEKRIKPGDSLIMAGIPNLPPTESSPANDS